MSDANRPAYHLRHLGRAALSARAGRNDMLRFAPFIRIGLVILGALLVVGAFVAVLTLGIGTNPPHLRIAVAGRDIAQGEQLKASDYRIVEQILDPRLAQLYVQEDELADYDGAFVVETLRRGDPINKVKLAMGSDATALRRYSLALKDPNFVIMTLPVNPDVIPSKITPGDHVNILFAGGSESGINRLPDPTVVPELPAAMPIEQATPDANSALAPMSIVESTPEVVLPLADLMLEHVEVLDVNFQQVQNTSYGMNASGSDQPFLNGPITSIVVKVPRSHQTLLAFGASVSRLRFSVASPVVDASALLPQLGVDWGKYVDLYRWKESQVVARGETLTQTLYPNAQVASVATVSAP
jgi:hypothetical protein